MRYPPKVRTTLLAWLLLCVVSSSALAQQARVVLVNPPKVLQEAAQTALTPWDTEVQAVKAKRVASSPQKALRQARMLSDQQSASIVAWISKSDGAAILWLFDAESDQLVARPIDWQDSLDEAQAASIALSLKTLLRHSRAAPEEERFGAERDAPIAAPRPSATPRGLSLEAYTGLRYTRSEAETTQMRLGLGASLPLPYSLEALAQLRIGTGLSARSSEIVGHYRITSFSTGLRRLLAIGDDEVGAQLGFSMHWGRFGGTLVEGGSEVSASRLNPSIDTGLMWRRWLSRRVGLAASAEASWLLRRQRFLLRGEPIFTLPQVDWLAGVWVIVALQ
jgi:hypothetical protein